MSTATDGPPVIDAAPDAAIPTGHHRLTDGQLAANLATEAGRFLVTIRDRYRGDLSTAATLGAGAVYDHVTAVLAAVRPGDLVLPAEGLDLTDGPTSDRCWFLQPLDGREQFLEPGRTDWAVHLALWDRSALATGAVALPARRRTYTSANAPGLGRRAAGPLRIGVRRTRPCALSKVLAERLHAVLVPVGSAGSAAMAVVTGELDVYVHDGGDHGWAWAGPLVVAQTSGVHACRLDGSPPDTGSTSRASAGLLFFRPEFEARLGAALLELSGAVPAQ